MHPRGIAERGEIMLERARIDGVEIFRFGLARHLVAQEEVGIAADQRFRQRVRLRQKGPVIDFQRVQPVDSFPVLVGRQDIQHSQPRQPAGMVKRKTIGDPAAAVVTGECEMHMAELLHRLDHRLRHRALGVGRVVPVAVRHVRPAVARQVGDDQREGVGKLRRNAVPHHMGLGEAVQQ